MDNNTIYQELIQKNKIIAIKIMRPGKDQQTVIKKKSATPPTVMKASVILRITGDDERDKHIIDFFLKKLSQVHIYTQEIMRDIILLGSLK